jgi:hypothetical protein
MSRPVSPSKTGSRAVQMLAVVARVTMLAATSLPRRQGSRRVPPGLCLSGLGVLATGVPSPARRLVELYVEVVTSSLMST